MKAVRPRGPWPHRHACPSPGKALSGPLIALLCACLLAAAGCHLLPETFISDTNPPENPKNIRTFDLNEKLILKGIARVCKNRGFTEVTVVQDENRVETGYLVEEDWRTKVSASVKKISRQEREVTLTVFTEKKSASGWEPKNIMGKEQYDRLFNEIELQIYRELYKAE